MSANPDTAAPTGRNKPAQGKERSDAALGHASQNTSSPEGAKENGSADRGMNSFLPAHLPADWQQLPLEPLVTRMSNGISKRQTKDGNGLPVSRIETISQGVIDLTRVGYLSGLTAAEAEKYRLESGDLLFSHINSDLHLGKTAVFSMEGETLLHGMNLLLIRVDRDKLLPVYLHWLFNYYRVAGLFMSIAQHAVNQSSINQRKLNALPIVVPPLPEQRRIVAEIEKQFTRLEAGVAALRRVQANLKRYRAAVLKAACEGRLVPTEAALARSPRSTKNGPPAYETGEALLARILTERRQNWQGRGQYKEPAAPDTTNLPTLPDSWTWVSWEMVLAPEDGAFKRGPFGSALTKAIFVEKGFKVYEQYCPINDDCSFARYYITPEKFEELQAFEVKAGDYLISCSGVTLGRITRVPEQFERGIINQALLRVRINESVINHRYFLHLFRSALFQKAIFDNSTGSAIPNVKGVKELKAMAIPLPPLAEQTRIVAEVERRLSVVEELESVVSASLQRATRLRQSILQKAFTGELLQGDYKP